MSNQVTIFNKEFFTISTSKLGITKTGSIALFIAKGSSKERTDLSFKIYQEQIGNGQYKPAARDIVEHLVPKTARDFLSVSIDTNGPMKKADFILLCRQVDYVVRKSGKEQKGLKGFIYEIVKQVVSHEVESKGEIVSSQ